MANDEAKTVMMARKSSTGPFCSRIGSGKNRSENKKIKSIVKVTLLILNNLIEWMILLYRAFRHYLEPLLFFKVLLIGLFAFFISGCAANYAPVEQRGTTPYSVKKKYQGKTPGYHIVKKGDTLYSIAWMYGFDYKSLAYKNRIKPPYRIYAGNKIQLISATRYRNTNNSKTASYKKSDKKSSTKQKTSSKFRSSTKNKSTSNSKRAVKTKNKTATYTGSKRLNWIWPVKGKIIQSYSPGSGKKGIDISASKGALIKSSEAGKVVYSGQGLVGYGRLIIIKHNETYLSAYAHNQSLLVNEGQIVNKGQNIARLGRSGTNRYKLHFEIRKNGKPVNPMSYLRK